MQQILQALIQAERESKNIGKTSVGDSDAKEITDSLGQGSFGAYQGVLSQCQHRWSELARVL